MRYEQRTSMYMLDFKAGRNFVLANRMKKSKLKTYRTIETMKCGKTF